MNARQQMDKDQKKYMDDLYVKDAKRLLKSRKRKKQQTKEE